MKRPRKCERRRAPDLGRQLAVVLVGEPAEGRVEVEPTAGIDLAVGGARPLWLSCAMIIEEGLAVDELRRPGDEPAAVGGHPGRVVKVKRASHVGGARQFPVDD